MASSGPKTDTVTKPSQYGREWSQGLLVAGLVTAGVWVPAYTVVTDDCADCWWIDFAIAFIVIAGLITLSWLTCAIAEYLERRHQKR